MFDFIAETVINLHNIILIDLLTAITQGCAQKIHLEMSLKRYIF